MTVIIRQLKTMHELKFLHELELYRSEFLILSNTFVPAFTTGTTSNNKVVVVLYLYVFNSSLLVYTKIVYASMFWPAVYRPHCISCQVCNYGFYVITIHIITVFILGKDT